MQEFEAFTADLYRLAHWMTECGVQTVVMESTGVYWIPLFEVLEERGFQVMLVDPRRIKNVPGRKTDVLDCQWLQQLHSYGLLSGAFPGLYAKVRRGKKDRVSWPKPTFHGRSSHAHPARCHFTRTPSLRHAVSQPDLAESPNPAGRRDTGPGPTHRGRGRGA